MTEQHVAQVLVEALVRRTPALQSAQQLVEALVRRDPQLRAAQVVVEALVRRQADGVGWFLLPVQS